MRIHLDCVSVSEAGDYVQVSFTTEHDADGPYMIVQRQFEDPDDDLCYIETHDNAYTGHFRILSAHLERQRFRFRIERVESPDIEVTFNVPATTFLDLKRVLTSMIPELEIAGTEFPADDT